MVFYLDALTAERMVNPLFGKKRYEMQLISISLLCENGNQYFAVSPQFDKSRVPRDILNNLPVNTSGLWKPLEMIADDMRLFISYHAGREDVEICTMGEKPFTIFSALYGGTACDKYPDILPGYFTNLAQTINELLMDMQESEFQSDMYSLIPPKDDRLSLSERIDIFYSHQSIPEQNDDTEYNIKEMVMYLSNLHKFVKEFKHNRIKKEPQNKED